MANKTNFSDEFKAQQFKPRGAKANDTQMVVRLKSDLKQAIKQNAPDMSEWVRLALENAAREEGWL